MTNSIAKLLFATLLAAQHLLASAGDVHSGPEGFGNSSTITYDLSLNGTYDPTAGGIGLFIDKRVFQVEAPTNYALTGKMSATLTALYEIGEGVQGTAYINVIFDVLLPHCDFCGPFDSDLIGTSRDGTFADDGSSMQYAAHASNASGLYSRLLVYEITVGSLPRYAGHIEFQSLVFNIETVALELPTSAVPELPPIAFYGLGLAALGVIARVKSSKRQTGIRV